LLDRLKNRAGIEQKPEPVEDGEGPPAQTPSARAQKAAFWVTIVAALLALGAGTGLSPIPRGTPALAYWLHPLVVLLGVLGGLLAVKRAREIDEERWRVVGDDSLTSGERAYAHKEAEREMRSAATSFLLAALAVATWLAYQLRIPGEITVADLLIATPVLGFLVGLGAGVRVFERVGS